MRPESSINPPDDMATGMWDMLVANEGDMSRVLVGDPTEMDPKLVAQLWDKAKGMDYGRLSPDEKKAYLAVSSFYHDLG